MNPQIVDADDEYEYEYEYDDTETETFFVDIDLSSLNPTDRSGVPPRMTPAKRKLNDSADQIPDLDEPSPDNAGSPAGEAQATTMQEPQDTPAAGADTDRGTLPQFPSRVQILDLNSVNPIISYQGQVFSCTWNDMVGTNMFFTHPEMLDTAEVLRSTDGYDLIGMSRIKLAGHRARLAKKTTEADANIADVVDQPPADAGDAADSQDPVKKTRDNQSAFLERVMEIKRQRGEKDIAETYIDG